MFTLANADIIDTSFDAHLDTSTFINKRVTRMIVLPNGKMIATGFFNRYNGRNVGRMIRVNSDGTIDNSYPTDIFDAPVEGNDRFKLLPDGKIIVCGVFTLADGAPQNFRVIRLNADGTVDNSFVFEPTGNAERSEIDAAGRVYVWGNLQYVRNGQTISRYLLRLNSNGTVDDSFNGPEGEVSRFTAQGNKIVYYVYESGMLQVRRLNEDGSPDSSFTQTAVTPFNFNVFTTQSDNKLLLLRETTLIRLNADGGVDNTFQPPTFAGVGTSDMIVMSDDRITVRYSSSSAPSGARFIRLLPNGSADPTFTPYLYTPDGYPVWGLHSDGSVMIGDTGLDHSANTFVRLFANGQVDGTYNSGQAGFQNLAPGKIRSIKVLPSNKILIAGDFDRVNTTPKRKLALLNHNSTLDPTFSINTTPTGNYFSQLNDIYDVELQSDGKFLISGNFIYFIGGSERRNVVRLNADGSIDPSFILNMNINDHYASSFMSTNRPVPRPDGKIVIASSKIGPGSSDPQPPIQLLPGGTRDTSFSPTLYLNETVVIFDLAILPSGKILIAGRRSYLESGTNSVHKGIVARLNSDGTTDASFQRHEPLNQVFIACRVLPDGKILVVHKSASASRPYRLNEDGTPDPTFNDGVGANGRINAMAVLDDGRILVGGLFTAYNGEARRNLALLSSDGALLPRIVDTNKEVLCLSLDNSGRVLVGGFFTSLQEFSGSLIGGSPMVEISYLARLDLDAVVPTARAPFDLDGDGKTDIGIFRPSVGEWWINRSSNGSTFAAQFGATTDQIVPADFTGDGKMDLAFWRPSTGEWFVLRSEDYSYFSVPFGAAGDIPAPADYDADGKADVAVFRPLTATWYVSRSTGGTHIEQFGTNGDQPVVGDYDGDGRADIAIYRPSLGQWWLKRSTAGVIALTFGSSTDKPVQGDYTGDGKADMTFWRPSTGEWYVSRSEDFSYFAFPFGATGDIPAPGDYDGDGRYDATVFRPSSATWYVQRTTAGTLIQQFGAGGDRPIANAYVP